MVTRETAIGRDAQLSWILAALAGMVGAVAFLHSAGYFVTFMTGNTERLVVSNFSAAGTTVAGPSALAVGALLAAFVLGVISASYCRRRLWRAHPHGPVVLTTISLLAAAALDLRTHGTHDPTVNFGPILLITFAIGALNTSFVKNGEVSIPLSYVTGTIVKLGQGIERHATGYGTRYDWLGYALLYLGFLVGAAIGSVAASAFSGPVVILAAGVCSGLASIVTFMHSDRRSPFG